jgi:hypothetical protein
MLGWFRPKCPLATCEKTWVEWRMRWLAEQFGIDRLLHAPVILPTEEFFPAELAVGRNGAKACLVRMCGYMGVDPAAVEMEVRPDDDMPGAAGLYQIGEQSIIILAESQLSHPPQLLATLAHELAHELLLKGGHLTQATRDHEQVTDLLPVFLGTGIFLANATVKFASTSDGAMHSWSIARQGYLSSITLGYALAVFAFVRGEDRPPWAAHLRTDAAVTLRAGLNYLRKTGDSLFHPDTAGTPRRPPSMAEAIDLLGNASATTRLSALWEIEQREFSSAALVAAVEDRLRDRDLDVHCAAARVLGNFGAQALRAAPKLVAAAAHGPPLNRAAAMVALGRIGAEPNEVVSILGAALVEEESIVGFAAADALTTYGHAAQAAEPQLLAAIAGFALTDYPRLESLLTALRAVSPDPIASVKKHFVGTDGEVRRLVLGVLKDLANSP